MKKKYKTLVKNIGLFTIGSFGSKILSFLMLPIYTSVLNSADYGVIDLFQSTAQLLIPILLLSIQDAVLKFGMDYDYNKEDVLSTAISIVIKGTCLLLFGIIVVQFLNIFNISYIYWIFLFLIFVFSALNNIFSIYLKSKNDAKTIAISGILCTFITCGTNILLLVVFKFKIIGYMISILLGIFIQVLYQFYVGKIYRDIHLFSYKNLSKPMIKYSSPLIANSLAWWVNNASDRYILTWIYGVGINGIYAIAYKIPTILTTFQNIFYNAWSISAIKEFDKEDKDGFIGNNYVSYSFISMCVCSLIMLFNIPIAKLLYSNEFYDAWKCVPFLLTGTVFNGIAQFEGSLFAATKRTKEVSVTTIIGAIFNTLCNFILIKFLGIIGAAISTLIGYLLTWILRTIFLLKFMKMKVNWKLHLISIILLIVQAILATFNCYYLLQIIIFILILIIHSGYIKKLIYHIKRKT